MLPAQDLCLVFVFVLARTKLSKNSSFPPKDNILSAAVLGVDVFGSRAANQAQVQNSLNFGCLQRVYG